MENNWYDKLWRDAFNEDIYKNVEKPNDYEETCLYVIEKLTGNEQVLIRQKYELGHSNSSISTATGFTLQYVGYELKIAFRNIRRMKQVLIIGKNKAEEIARIAKQEESEKIEDLVDSAKNNRLRSDITIDFLFSCGLISVRTRNSLKRNEFLTIGDIKNYVFDGYPFKNEEEYLFSSSPTEKILSLGNIGRKTADEILKLVAKCN